MNAKVNENRKRKETIQPSSPPKYDLGEHLITGKQVLWKKIIEWFLTSLGWMILLSFVLYFSYGYLALTFHWNLPQFYVYNTEMLMELKKYFFILFVAALFFAIFLILWKNYNFKKFGRLRRRKFRADVTDLELTQLFQITEEQLYELKNERLIVLDKNIIPDHLGTGQNPKQNKRSS